MSNDILELTEEQQREMNELNQNATDPDAIAATLFSLYFPKFEILVDQLSNNALRRMIKHLVGAPIIEVPFKAQSDNEQNAYAIGDRLLESKYVMIFNALAQEGLSMNEQAHSTETNNMPETNGETNNAQNQN